MIAERMEEDAPENRVARRRIRGVAFVLVWLVLAMFGLVCELAIRHTGRDG